MPIEGKWEHLLPLFEECKTQKMINSIIGHVRTAPSKFKKDLLHSLHQYLVTKKFNSVTEYEVMVGIFRLLDGKNIKWFKEKFSQAPKFQKALKDEDLNVLYPDKVKILSV